MSGENKGLFNSWMSNSNIDPGLDSAINFSAGFGIKSDIANIFTEDNSGRHLPRVTFDFGFDVPLDLANVDRASTETMEEKLYTGIAGILLLVAVVAGPLGSALNAFGEVVREQQEIGELDVRSALNQVPWINHLNGFDLEDGWTALRTPEVCRSKLVCEMHNMLTNQPPHTLRLIKKLAPLVNIEKEYQGAARNGLKGEDCTILYPQCKMSGLQYLVNINPTD